ncbi:hypothetical protein ACFYXS_35580 [Streptomyces sp. NPDC002574]|uniref:hypothetical protein n=1 Tax=Streptomyces sp. NPDC002574 TaxID=3364652 RepID=UPI003680A18A
MKPDSAAWRPAVADGIARCEDFLSWQAEIGDAYSAAAAFADRMPWLTTAQRDEVVRLYTVDRLDVARGMLTRFWDRDQQLHLEYARRFNDVRTRLLSTVAALALVTAAVCLPVPLLLLFGGA